MRRCLAIFLCLALLPATAAAQPTEVDVELVLMVDVSRSMSPAELEIQRRGYAEALVSDQVVGAIGAGLLGRVALTYVEWAGVFSHRTIVDWRLLETRADAVAFADALRRDIPGSMRRTSIAGAIDHAQWLMVDNGFDGLRRVIDISGDGPNNSGRPVTEARDAAVAQGIIINGLPLMTRDGGYSQWHLDDLDRYYVDCVIGGPGAFVIPVYHWRDFARAVRRKIVLELAGRPLAPPPVPVQFERPQPAYDCLIGEKIWERQRRDWGMP